MVLHQRRLAFSIPPDLVVTAKVASVHIVYCQMEDLPSSTAFHPVLYFEDLNEANVSCGILYLVSQLALVACGNSKEAFDFLIECTDRLGATELIELIAYTLRFTGIGKRALYQEAQRFGIEGLSPSTSLFVIFLHRMSACMVLLLNRI